MPLLLRQWRQRRGLTVRELGRRAGVSFVTIVRVETERVSPTVRLLEKLAAALDITVRDFFPAETRPRRRGKRRK